MRVVFTLLITVSLLFNSCRRDCGCSPPPLTETKWKITDRSGGIAGGHIGLTDDQKNNILTIKPGGIYSCTNTVTGAFVTGILSMSNFNSIYGDRTRLIFAPKLPMLAEDYLILIDNPSGKMIFGDNTVDGYLTIFELVP
jgi:hypothetical protein